ncbi:MOSC domain-containing protein [Actinokineospora xionganensis]|uniref:MOSC domain-containing protein n=1 Tax=Actinokineospora xionganensis TaxID=2684470 RepID=A0ABR7LBM0_9PSEU|nr:MOSC domain-containing protein [Actinokineospora xionganensis]MBC6450080.1 MOSC domain-containing protein [Actinokineospora xionganensis]
MAKVLSVNLGVPRPIEGKSGISAIDKRPVDHPVAVREPEPAAGGLAGDRICDKKNHGGPDQAVYAYAREDLDAWESELGVSLASGGFGENLTTLGVDVTGAEVGERWRVGPDLELQVTSPRIPCQVFAVWMERQGWVKTFTQRAIPGAYFKVITPGTVSAGDEITVVHRPGHGVTMGMTFRAITTEPELLPELLAADDLPEDLRAKITERLAK